MEPGQGLPWFSSSFRLAGSNHLEDPASGSKCISKMEGKLGCSGSQGLGGAEGVGKQLLPESLKS